MANVIPPGLVGTDGTLKALDANRYATKKTIAQGMLDIALLTANASQLKYVLQVGAKHEFYRLMLTLITISISLQATAAVICIVLIFMDMGKSPKHTLLAGVLNDIALGMGVCAVFVDVLKMNFGFDAAIPVKTMQTS